MDDFFVRFDWPDEWAKSRILSNTDVSVAKRIHQSGGSVILWAGIADEINSKLCKVDEGV